MQISPKGVALIQQFERCRHVSYADGGGVWTIGWGHTGPDVKPALIWTQAQCDAAFLDDIQYIVKYLNTQPYVLSQNEFDALCSLIYNWGLGHFMHSAMRNYLLSSELNFAANEFQLIIHDKLGNIEPGLVARRRAEEALFNA